MKRSLFAIVALSVLLSSPALADDLNPPPWRGEPRTTYAQWEFYTPGDDGYYPQPDQWSNPYGPPWADVTPGPGMQWYPEWEGRPGVWPLSGEIVICIPDFPEPLPEKWIWIQLTWAPQYEGAIGFLSTEPPYSEGTVSTMPLEPPWNHSTVEFVLRPNPPYEYIYIWGDINVDEIVIDTICIPEPASLSLLGLATLLLRRRR